MTHDEILYIAGLLEGEGNFYIGDNNQPKVSFGMTDEDVVRRYRSIAGGGSIYKRESKIPGHKPMFITYVFGREAIELMKAVRPIMGLRRGQCIDDIIIQYDSKLKNGDGKTICKHGHDLTHPSSYRINMDSGGKICKKCKYINNRDRRFKIVSQKLA